jgi:excinuclease UvrABC nuclease subunit
MTAGMTKSWIVATPASLATIPVGTGVYEIRDEKGEVLDIGYAGSREPFGLRSRIADVLDDSVSTTREFRFEQHVQYHSRFVELILDHRAQHGGCLPDRVAMRSPSVHGRLTP